ncbi:MAG: ABC transporter substrate-binding protein [Hyphomicrobiales bacterium]|nr:ABC transporter substrate-binding protein [Hyphomicrobiales bacterium]MBV9429800.1 ABC transporter substrate-binding protein [Bradyrhizobiaceae bacterium]
MITALAALGFHTFTGTDIMAQTASPEIVKELAPTGKLRAAINFGNPVLAQKDAATGDARGVTGDLARELAKRLGVSVEFVAFDTAGKVSGSAKDGIWDICFLAIDPVRAADIAFTGPYVVIEGVYIVPKDSALQTVADVDRAGVRIAVGKGSAYDLFLTREIKNATLVRDASSGKSLDMFLHDKLEAGAGVKQPVVAFAKQHPDTRVIPGRFMAIEQAMGTVKGRSDAAARYLRAFVEEMKASGFVAKALHASGQGDAEVAPPTPVN